MKPDSRFVRGETATVLVSPNDSRIAFIFLNFAGCRFRRSRAKVALLRKSFRSAPAAPTVLDFLTTPASLNRLVSHGSQYFSSFRASNMSELKSFLLGLVLLSIWASASAQTLTLFPSVASERYFDQTTGLFTTLIQFTGLVYPIGPGHSVCTQHPHFVVFFLLYFI